MFTTTSKNIDFLRWRFGTHEALAEKLKGVVNWNQLSKFATAESVPPPSTQRSIETSINLPFGWCDRDNLAFTELSAQDHELVSTALMCKPATKASLQAFLVSLREETIQSSGQATACNV